jgi:chromosome segregation ATPase
MTHQCVHCSDEAVARLSVGSLGVQDDLCAAHLRSRSAAYELSLTPSHVTSLVRTPERVEDAYKDAVVNLRDAERATREATQKRETLEESFAALGAKYQALAGDYARLHGESAQLGAELVAERSKLETLCDDLDRTTLARNKLSAEVERLAPFEELSSELEAQLSKLERLTGIKRESSEADATAEGWPAPGQPSAVVEGSERPATEPPPTGREGRHS